MSRAYSKKRRGDCWSAQWRETKSGLSVHSGETVLTQCTSQVKQSRAAVAIEHCLKAVASKENDARSALESE